MTIGWIYRYRLLLTLNRDERRGSPRTAFAEQRGAAFYGEYRHCQLCHYQQQRGHQSAQRMSLVRVRSVVKVPVISQTGRS